MAADSNVGVVASTERPRVLAVLVVHDGMPWLPSVLSTLAAQDDPVLDLVAIDNGSEDGSSELLERRIPPDRLVRLRRSVGLGEAVAAALETDAANGIDAVLIVHDDLLLAPDAARRLTDALAADPQLAAVGPKLREWREEPTLQEVGRTLDPFGRPDLGLERDELDQGQADAERDVLAVSTAGMLVRREALEAAGGFDPRMPAMGDDVDLCWRAWLAGWRVAVHPAAVGYHVAAGSRGARSLWGGVSWKPRYLAERHAVATLARNLGGVRLAWALPIAMLLAVAKTLGFLATRRVGAAIATARAWGWNALQLPVTLRRRHATQRARVRGDAEVVPLLAPAWLRLRQWADAVRAWASGSGTPELLAGAVEDRPVERGGRLVRVVREHPALTAGLGLLVVYLVGVASLLGPGSLVGGEVRPWPDDAGEFFSAYLRPFGGDPLGAVGYPSPVQAALGAASAVLGGSAWLAERVLVLGLVPLAWMTALRAGRLITALPGPRVVGATVYAASAPVAGALAQGRWGALLVAALLPAIVLQAIRVGDRRTDLRSAWRATAVLAVLGVVAIGAAPASWVLVAGALGLAGIAALRHPAGGRGRPWLRITTATVAIAALVAPWAAGVLGSVARLPAQPEVPLTAWRALTLTPVVLPGLEGGAGVGVAVALVAGLVGLGLGLGVGLRPLPVTGLVGGLVVSATLAWAAARVAPEAVWTPLYLQPGALAAAGLGMVGARAFVPALRAHAFGVRHVAAITGAALVAVGLVAGVVRVGGDPWVGVQRSLDVVPPTVTLDAERVGPYRLLLLAVDDEGVRWEVTDHDGVSMVSMGDVTSPGLGEAIERAVDGLATASDLEAGARLALAGVRDVVLTSEAAESELGALLRRQPRLEPLLTGGGQVFRVASWVPRAAVLPDDTAEALRAGRGVHLDEDAVTGLAADGPGRWRGEAGPGVVLVTEEPRGWTAQLDGEPLAEAPLPDAVAEELPRTAAFVVPERGEVVVEAGDHERHRLLVIAQAVVLAGVASLLLRPPRYAIEPRPTRGRRRVPAARDLPGLADVVDAEPERRTDVSAGAGSTGRSEA